MQSNSQDDLLLAELDPRESTSIITQADLQDDVLVPLQPDLQEDASVMQPYLQENSSAKVLIVDVMAVLQSMKKATTMLTLSNFQNAFNKHIKEMMTGYDEGRVMFDFYMEQSLKNIRLGKREQLYL